MEVFFVHVAHAAGHYTHQKLVLYSWRIFIDLDEAEKAKYCNPTEALTPPLLFMPPSFIKTRRVAS